MSHREIKSHHVNGVNLFITVLALGLVGAGNAHSRYKLQLRNKAPDGAPDGPLHSELSLNFQEGAIGDAGPNGFTNEALLAVLIDRLEGFQAGPYACKENAEALAALKAAQAALASRTVRRVAEGTEGTLAPDKGNAIPPQVDTAALNPDNLAAPATAAETAATPEAEPVGATTEKRFQDQGEAGPGV